VAVEGIEKRDLPLILVKEVVQLLVKAKLRISLRHTWLLYKANPYPPILSINSNPIRVKRNNIESLPWTRLYDIMNISTWNPNIFT
jgi:hypothetical protein